MTLRNKTRLTALGDLRGLMTRKFRRFGNQLSNGSPYGFTKERLATVFQGEREVYELFAALNAHQGKQVD
jgi:hypothetical protein